MTNRDDFEQLVRRHHALVYRTAFGLLRDEASAQDAAQDVFLRLAREPKPLAGAESPAKVLRWLAVRTALEHLRGARNRRAREEDYAMEHEKRFAAAPDELAAERGAAQALERELHALRADLRAAVELRFREGMTFAAIGAAVGVSEPSAHARVHKGLETLRARLARLGFAAFAAAPLERALAAPLDVPVPAELAPRILARLAPGTAGPVPKAAAGLRGLSALSGSRLLGTAPAALVAVALAVVGWRLASPSETPGPDGARGGAVVAAAAAPEAVGELASPGAPPAARTATATEASPAATEETPEGDVEPAGTLAGRVVDADGNALAGVRVHAFATERTGKMPRFERIAASGADGSFTLALPVAYAEGQLYRLDLWDRDFVRGGFGPERVRAGSTSALGDLTLARNSDDVPGEYTLALLLLDERDAPLAGADVIVARTLAASREWDREVVETHGRTDDNGRVELSGDRLGSKTVRIDARGASPAAGIATVELDAATAGRVERTVRVPAGAAIAGRVLTIAGGVPRSFQLTLAKPLADGGTRWDQLARAAIGADGAFRFDGLAPGRYDVWGDGDGWSTVRLDSVEAGREALSLFIKRSDDERDLGDHMAELHGRAIDPETGAPLGIAWLDLEVERLADGLNPAALRADALPNALSHSMAQVMLPAGGEPSATPEFHFDGLVPGTYAITLFAKDRAVGVLGPIALGSGEVRRGLVVAVPRGATVSGVVRGPDEKPLEGAWLVVTGDGPLSRTRVAEIDAEVREDDGRQPFYFGARARTGADGRFELTHLPPDLPLRLAAVHAQLAPGWSEPVLLREGERHVGVPVDLRRR